MTDNGLHGFFYYIKQDSVYHFIGNNQWVIVKSSNVYIIQVFFLKTKSLPFVNVFFQHFSILSMLLLGSDGNRKRPAAFTF